MPATISNWGAGVFADLLARKQFLDDGGRPREGQRTGGAVRRLEFRRIVGLSLLYGEPALLFRIIRWKAPGIIVRSKQLSMGAVRPNRGK